MKKILSICAITLLFGSLSALAAPQVGEVVPNFKSMDSNAQEFELSAQKGNIVVLEWTNAECPFVKKHYDSNNMQSLQSKYTEQGVVWVSIISSAPGKQGYLENGAQANDVFNKRNSKPTHIIRDEDGKIGKLFNAATTPHMFVVDKEGNLAYQGAIDSVATADQADLEGAVNYVSKALDELLAGKEVSKKVTNSYGCSVKY